MKDGIQNDLLEIQGDLHDEYQAIQAAEADEAEKEDYTQEDAWRDFWQDREDAFN